eukprot:1160487-Pelagomonas_calceolata.AAC.2
MGTADRAGHTDQPPVHKEDRHRGSVPEMLSMMCFSTRPLPKDEHDQQEPLITPLSIQSLVWRQAPFQSCKPMLEEH